MALGGYKFAGYKYTRPANYDSSDDAQVLAEALKMHKCKLKAFTESCAASGAQWDFSYSNGDYTFGTHGNVIYKMDSSGFNLVSFFRYGEENAYYAIVTLTDAHTLTGQSLHLSNFYYYFRGTADAHTVITNDMSCVSLTDITMSNINTYPSLDRLALSSDSVGYTTESSTVALAKSIQEFMYYGYVTKGKCIISIMNGPSGHVAVKISAVDSLKLASPGDTKNIFSYTLNMSNIALTPNVNTDNGYIQSLTDEGIPYENAAHSYNTTYNAKLLIQSPKMSVSFNPTSNIPYESAAIIPDNTIRRPSQPLNKDGIMAKGESKIDMMAVNLIYPYDNINVRTPYANGNYLNCWKYVDQSSNSSMTRLGKIFYVGWDPSNPDITQESSWPAYTE